MFLKNSSVSSPVRNENLSRSTGLSLSNRQAKRREERKRHLNTGYLLLNNSARELKFSFEFPFLVAFDHVPDFDVVEVFDADPTFIAGFYFQHVLLKAF